HFPAARTTTALAIVKKNFSLLLALRYLNPLRTHVSVITLISLAGVAVGVMVLVVVLSVFGGFEQMLKDRILSYTPHITIQRVAPWPEADEFSDYSAEDEWRSVTRSMNGLEGVENAYPLVNDFVILDKAGSIAPSQMQALDTDNSVQMQALQDLIKPGSGTANMGLGENAVISSLAAEKFDIIVGDTIQIHSSRNLEQIKPALERIGSKPFAVSHKELIDQIKSDLSEATRSEADGDHTPIKTIEHVYLNGLAPLLDGDTLRSEEADIISAVMVLLEQGKRSTEKPDDSGDYIFPAGHIATVKTTLDQLSTIDVEKADSAAMREMKSLILPKDLKVVGIYRATRHVFSPDVFVPLHVGQDVTGLGDKVRGVALRLNDPYKAQQILDEVVRPNMPKNGAWQAYTWMEDHQQQFGLVKLQRKLLVFALFFIMLVSAFSIMAVMFTVTIQKKREIGVMKALGATPSQLVRVFLYQGIIIGVFGGLLGILLGYIVIENRQSILDVFASWGLDFFPADFNGFDQLPATINLTEFAIVGLSAVALCILSTFIPAYLASRSDAARSLRNM
ncbi:MAG: ABC transporter permease, partial [Akkermansiaceae bacterium]